jgi:hypothetical protein
VRRAFSFDAIIAISSSGCLVRRHPVGLHQGLRHHDMTAQRDGHERRDERDDKDLKHGLPPKYRSTHWSEGMSAGFTHGRRELPGRALRWTKTQILSGD